MHEAVFYFKYIEKRNNNSKNITVLSINASYSRNHLRDYSRLFNPLTSSDLSVIN